MISSVISMFLSFRASKPTVFAGVYSDLCGPKDPPLEAVYVNLFFSTDDDIFCAQFHDKYDNRGPMWEGDDESGARAMQNLKESVIHDQGTTLGILPVIW